ncbi:hypothetical protein [Salinicola acroporae]|uniref:hypothetical protein n=1 Tax=Salinicola acroporae TaxID=1541440 RepID=UPI0031BA71DB
MSDPRPGQRFTLDDAPTPEEPASVQGARYYRPTQASDPYPQDETADATAIDAAIAPPRKRRWGLMIVLGGALGLGTIEAAHTLYLSTLGGDWLAGAWSLIGLTAVGLGTKALFGELWRLRKLRRHARLRRQLDEEWVDDTSATRSDPLTLAGELREQMGLSRDHPSGNPSWTPISRITLPRRPASWSPTIFSTRATGQHDGW